MTGRTHRISFRGSITTVDHLAVERSDVVVIDDARLERSVNEAQACIVIDRRRPALDDVERICHTVDEHTPRRVVAVGGGAAIDAAKRTCCRSGAGAPSLVIAPAGVEPWRAFVPFGVLVDVDGNQDTEVDERMATSQVLLVRELLAARRTEESLLTAVDMLVCGIESLLSNRAQPYSTAVAEAGGTLLIHSIEAMLDGDRPPPESVVVASALIAESFVATGLGLAHAVSTNTAAAVGLPQERINAIAGALVAGRWGRHPRLDRLRDVVDAPETDNPLAELIGRATDHLRVGTLADVGIVRGDVQRLMPRITSSSGIAHLPEPLLDREIAAIVTDLAAAHEPESMTEIEVSTDLDASPADVFEIVVDVEARAANMAHVERVVVLDGRARPLIAMHETVDDEPVVITTQFVVDRPRWVHYEHVGVRPFGPNRGHYEIVDREVGCVLRQVHVTAQDLDARPSLREEWLANMRATHQLIGTLVADSACRNREHPEGQ